MAKNNTFLKDPAEILDYVFDWKALTNGTGTSDWLGAAETISTFTVTVPTGLTAVSSSKTDGNTSVTVWLSGGTAGVDYSVVCRIVTSGSRTSERTMIIMCRER